MPSTGATTIKIVHKSLVFCSKSGLSKIRLMVNTIAAIHNAKIKNIDITLIFLFPKLQIPFKLQNNFTFAA